MKTTPKITDIGTNRAEVLEEMNRLSKLSPHSLIAEALNEEYSAELVVLELMHRACPDWTKRVELTGGRFIEVTPEYATNSTGHDLPLNT